MGRVATALSGLGPTQPFAAAARVAVTARARDLLAHVDGALDIDDPERLHELRVATRRLRSAFDVFAVCLPAAELGAVKADVRSLTRALGARRDCDVQIEILDGMRPTAGDAERKAIEKLLAGLSAEQREANRRLAKTLARVERRGLADRLTELTR